MISSPTVFIRLGGATLWAGACLGALAGCGASARPARPPVRLTVDAPSDRLTTLAGEVSVSGTVAPAGATVLVEGHPVAVQQGSFQANVPISPGENVIDVLAGAPRTAGAATALRVYRQVAVAVPNLGGLSPTSASTQLQALGLRATVVKVGGFFEALIPASSQVCQTVPAAGRRVAPGTGVQVQVAKLC